MLSIKVCQAILAANGKNYSEEEIKKICEFLYKLGEIEYELFQEINKSEDRSHLHTSLDR